MNFARGLKGLFCILLLGSYVFAGPLEDFKHTMNDLTTCADELEQCLNNDTQADQVDEIMLKLIACVRQVNSLWDALSFEEKNAVDEDNIDNYVTRVCGRLFPLLNGAVWGDKVPSERRFMFNEYFRQLSELIREFFIQDTQEKLVAFDYLVRAGNFDEAIFLGERIKEFVRYHSNISYAEKTLVNNFIDFCVRDVVRSKIKYQLEQTLEGLQSLLNQLIADKEIAKKEPLFSSKVATLFTEFLELLTSYKQKKGDPFVFNQFTECFVDMKNAFLQFDVKI